MANKKQKAHTFYVHIDSPLYLRREVLLCRKQMLQMLHKNARILALRKEKDVISEDLRVTIKEVYYLNNKLRSMLPMTHTRVYKEGIPEKEPDIRVTGKKTKDIIDTEFSHMAKIESELKDIENRLGRL